MDARKHGFLLAILLFFILIKLTLLFTYHFPEWDEAVYLGMGKSLYSGGQAGLWEPLRPLGMPLAIGIFWKLHFGYIKLAEIVSAAFAIGTIILVYATADLLFGRKTACISTILAATFPLFFAYSSHILSDIPAAFFGLLAVYLYARGKLLPAGASAGAAVMFKFTQGVLVIAFALALLIEALRHEKAGSAGKKSLLFAGGFTAVMLPFLLFNYSAYRQDASSAIGAALHPFLLAAWHQYNPALAIEITGLSSFLNNALFYFIVIAQNNFVMLLFILGAIMCILRPDGKKTALVIVTAALLAYFTYIPNKQERFILLFMPFIAILAGHGLFTLMQKHRSKTGVAAAIIILMLSSIFVSVLDTHYYLKRGKSVPEIVELYEYPDKNEVKGAILTSDPAFAAYTDRKLTPYYFSAEEGLQAYNSAESATIIFTPDSFYCDERNDGCTRARNELFLKIKSNELLYKRNFYGKDYYIYSK